MDEDILIPAMKSVISEKGGQVWFLMTVALSETTDSIRSESLRNNFNDNGIREVNFVIKISSCQE